MTLRQPALAACLGALMVSACVIVSEDSVALDTAEAMAPDAARAAVEERNRVFEARFAADDGVGVAALYTRDALLLPPDGPNVAGRAGIGAYWSAAVTGLGRVDLDTVAAEAVSADDIIEQVRVTFHDDEGLVLGQGKALVHWKREDGEWKLHRDIWNNGQ